MQTTIDFIAFQSQKEEVFLNLHTWSINAHVLQLSGTLELQDEYTENVKG